MFEAHTDSPEPPRPAPDGARRRMRLLQDLSEIGLRAAQRLDRQGELSAIYAETCAVPEHLQPPYARRLDEIARAFAQVARAVALVVALEERIESDLMAGPAAAAERALRRQLLAQRVASAEGAAPPTPSPAPADPSDPPSNPPGAPDLRPRLNQLFDGGVRDGGLGELDAWLTLPPEEIIAHVRRELGLDAASDDRSPREDGATGAPARSRAAEAPPRRPAAPNLRPARENWGQPPANAPAAASPSPAPVARRSETPPAPAAPP